MKYISLMLASVLLGSTMPAVASDAEVRKYCEDAALLMKVQGAQREAYIAACMEERTAQLKDEK